MFEVVLSEAVVITAIVTQEDISVLAMPHCLVSASYDSSVEY